MTFNLEIKQLNANLQSSGQGHMTLLIDESVEDVRMTHAHGGEKLPEL